MRHHETGSRAETDGETRFGHLVCEAALPSAIRSLENEELRTLLLAVLQEWRCRGANFPGG